MMDTLEKQKFEKWELIMQLKLWAEQRLHLFDSWLALQVWVHTFLNIMFLLNVKRKLIYHFYRFGTDIGGREKDTKEDRGDHFRSREIYERLIRLC